MNDAVVSYAFLRVMNVVKTLKVWVIYFFQENLQICSRPVLILSGLAFDLS